MSQVCPKCGTTNLPNHRFCSNCGKAISDLDISTSPPHMDAEGSSGQPVTYAVQRWESGQGSGSGPQEPGTREEPYAAYIPPAAASSPVTRAIPPPPRADDSGGIASYDPDEPTLQVPVQTDSVAPYSGSLSATVSKEPSSRSYLVPVAVVAALLLATLVGASVYLLNANKTAGTKPVTVSLPTGASDDDKVRAVVRQSNDEQIKAWESLDTEVLKGTRVGQVLQENIDMVEELRKAQMYAVPVNERLEITSVKIDGEHAQVRTLEVWTVTFYSSADKKRIQTKGPDTLTETYFLVKNNGQWLIERLEIDGQPTPTANPRY